MNQQAKDKAVSNIYLHAPLKRALNQCKGFAELAEPGSIGSCIGPSGAGKSVLATMLGPEVYGPRESWQSGRRPVQRLQREDRTLGGPLHRATS
jgi:ABC-type glutathione transport system ATPase component